MTKFSFEGIKNNGPQLIVYLQQIFFKWNNKFLK